MKHTKLALFTILLVACLSACKRDGDAPVVETPAPEPVAAPAVEPAPEPVAATPTTTTDPAATPVAPADATPAESEDDEDTPHSGGDKVGKPPTN